jgi:hypothetical protein
MPSHRQLLTTPAPKGGGATTGLGVFAPGSADYAAMRAMYPGSPAYDGTYDDAHVVAEFETVSASPINDGGHTFGTVNTDFTDAPDLTTVATGGGGLPGTPYSPTPAAPGPGMNPRNIPTLDPSHIRQGGGGYGVGDGLASPAATSVNIARQRIGNLIFGRSTPR